MTFHIDAFIKELTELRDDKRDAEQAYRQLQKNMNERLQTIKHKNATIANLKAELSATQERLALAEEAVKAVEIGMVRIPPAIQVHITHWQLLVRKQFVSNPHLKLMLDRALERGLDSIKSELPTYLPPVEMPEEEIEQEPKKHVNAAHSGTSELSQVSIAGPIVTECSYENHGSPFGCDACGRLANEVDGR